MKKTREIKFRVWDKDNKEIFIPSYPDEVQFDNGTPHWANCDEFVAMQFTGKKDKNGKEIYEGDIINVKDHPDFSAWGGVGFVLWDNRELSYLYGVTNGWSDLLCTPDKKQIEVIGNIYENPELLKEKVEQ